MARRPGGVAMVGLLGYLVLLVLAALLLLTIAGRGESSVPVDGPSTVPAQTVPVPTPWVSS